VVVALQERPVEQEQQVQPEGLVAAVVAAVVVVAAAVAVAVVAAVEHQEHS
jgi:hypothetical protein